MKSLAKRIAEKHPIFLLLLAAVTVVIIIEYTNGLLPRLILIPMLLLTAFVLGYISE